MKLIKLLLPILVSALVQAEDDQLPATTIQPPATELVEATTTPPPPPPPPPPPTIQPTPPTTQPPTTTIATPLEENVEYTDFRMSIDHSLGSILIRIIDWQVKMFNEIQSNLSPLLTQWNEIKSAIRETKSCHENSIRSSDVDHYNLLLDQQVISLKESLSTGDRIEANLVSEQRKIDLWLADVENNVEGSRKRKVNIIADLESVVNWSRDEIKLTKSSIEKSFQNHFYSIENDRLSINGKLDKLDLSFKAILAELITTIQITNNSVSNRLSQEANILQGTIDSTVSNLRHHLDSDLMAMIMAVDRDKIVNHLNERSQQLDAHLANGLTESQLNLDTYIQRLIQDINTNTWSLSNDLNTMKGQFEQLTSINKVRANRLSVQMYKTLEPVESLLSSLAKKLQRSVDSVRN